MRRKFAALLLLSALILGVVVSAVAATTVTKQLTAEYSGIQITLDGTKVEPKDVNGNIVEPFIVNGTTYLPVRALSNALGLDVDWDQTTQTVILKSRTEAQPTAPAGKFDAAKVANELKVTTYTWEDSNPYLSYAYLAIEVENTSEFTIDISANATFFDESNARIGAKSRSESCIPAGQKVLLVMSNDAPFARVEHTVTVSQTNEKYYKPTSQNITLEANETEDKLVVTAKNNGDTAAEFVEVTALFFKDGKPVDYDYTYCVDGDSELKPNAVQSSEIHTWDLDYDSYQLYITSRGYK